MYSVNSLPMSRSPLPQSSACARSLRRSRRSRIEARRAMARPQTLAEVASIARADRSAFAMALDEFVDEFYLDHPQKALQQRRLDAIPEVVGDAAIDAWIGAFCRSHRGTF